ncbi:DUF1289 domain-containing protein [Catenovulum sp. 2E275]|uniref:DUF1289 domain-containing protein n=1 Tax=Catenovulum sp. 2E275 TaxID=2980497 RepID=UPI0021D06E4C|nr:DUF1289 domain-containing protein [Catenovulum sp. 2E275]MCU4674418.1 DUF1289 domain-containing protein [Catenovulum sp. 2E275]
MSKVKSPCVRRCCLNEQDVCIGCGRTLDEITGWVELRKWQQQAVIKQAKLRLSKLSYKS